MSYPTRHWVRATGTLAAGARVTWAHGLREGTIPAIAPDAVLADMNTGVFTEPPNVSIGEYAARTTASVFLSNWDPAATHYYAVVARHYHSIDDANI